MGGQAQKIPPHTEKSHPATQEKHIAQRSSHQGQTGAETPVHSYETAASDDEKRVVIIGKRKTVEITQDDQNPSSAREKTGAYPEESVSLSEENAMSVEIRDRVFRARDEIFEGKGIRKPSLPQARDSTLLHTELRPKKRTPDHEVADDDKSQADRETKEPVSLKKRTRSE
jgi:hypothetical protein